MGAILIRHAIGVLLAICLLIETSADALPPLTVRAVASAAVSTTHQPGAAEDREIAMRFAPIFYQAVGPQRRNDYITNFDFDGDWRGDNNWANAENRHFHLRAYIYYGVTETLTHFFIHYAVFHPRDYKGGSRGTLLSEVLRQGVKRGAARLDPTGMAEDGAFAHENDMEGCLVVVAKNGNDPQRAAVAYVETLAHNHFLKYVPDGAAVEGSEPVRLEEQRPLLYIEPKGHGIKSDETSKKTTERTDILVYKFTGSAGDPEGQSEKTVGYDLLPLYETLWSRARSSGGVNETYGAAYDYTTLNVNVAQKSGQTVTRQINLGVLGAAFSGKVGAKNMARPPWGWFDRNERGELTGGWFFDPAQTIKRHFNPTGSFSLAYLHAPFLGLFRQ
jgi:hypothetical protein